MRARRVLCLAGTAGTMLAAGCGSSATLHSAAPGSAPPSRLDATVTANGRVSLRNANGASVSRVPAGWYTLSVRLDSTTGAFRLVGPGVDQVTKRVPGITLWGVQLRPGSYRYMDDGAPASTAHTLSVY